MRTKRRAKNAARLAAVFAATLLAACDSDSTDSPLLFEWQWTDLGGPDAMTPELVANHETLVVYDGALLIGTADGVWRRLLDAGGPDWERAGLEGRTIHALAVAADGVRLVAAGYDPLDEKAPTVWYSTTGGQDWIAAAEWPRGAPGTPDAGVSFRFASLEPDPVEAAVIYAGLDADSVAVSVDGGATWLLTNGASTPNFGYPCVAHRPRNADVLLQGCELPLDIAWIGARDVDVDDRFTLSNFRYVFGYPNLDELGNRRINAIASVSGRADRVLVGVEGGLLELSSRDGAWSGRDAIDSHVVYLARLDNETRPYTYMRAIAPLSASGRHVLFGGTVNGPNEVLSLFETVNGGITVRLVSTPMGFIDPRVEQAIALESNDVLVVISDIDAADRRTSGVYRLRRP